jgi:hypothetical protein
MKTLYLIKSFLPLTFLPIAPGVVQVELVRQGMLSFGGGAILTVVIQLVFTVAILLWAVRNVQKKTETKAFLKMSCVSKKVYHQGAWMTVEKYLSDHHNIVVSHGMTPEESQAWLQDSERWLRDEANAVAAERTEGVERIEHLEQIEEEQPLAQEPSAMFVE